MRVVDASKMGIRWKQWDGMPNQCAPMIVKEKEQWGGGIGSHREGQRATWKLPKVNNIMGECK